MAKLKYAKDGNYYFKCRFEERHLAEDAGLNWHSSKKLWYTSDLRIAGTLVRFADNDTAHSLGKRLHSLLGSSATESTLIVPAPPGEKYDPHQVAAIEWGVNNKAVLIADEQGLGKTIEAIGIANYFTFSKILVITIASMKYTWAEEIEKWSTSFPSIHVVEGTKPDIPHHATTLVVNYDIVRHASVQEAIERFAPFDLAIVDEAHYMKNPEAQRTKAIIGKGGLATLAGRHVLLTGTPMQSKPIELYPLLAAYARDLIRPYTDYWSFAKRYNGAYRDRWGWQLGAPTNREELNSRLREGFMLRRLKKDVMKNLPDKRYQIVPLQIGKSGKISKEVAELLDNAELTDAAMRKIDLGLKFDAHEKDMAALGEMVNERRDIAEQKLPTCLKHIKDTLSNTDKVIIFAHHKSIVGDLAAELAQYNPAVISGSVALKKRKAEVDRFQTDPSCRVFIGNMDAAGTGITLTAASTVICVEWSWVPGIIEQAVDRAHRRGQTEMVVAQFLVVKDTIEEYMMRRVIDKLKHVKQIVEKNYAINEQP